MEDVTIRKFVHTDVDDFIRLSKLSFAEETRAAGITPEEFEQETRRIFRWNMIPYKLLTALMGITWEGFVAEKKGGVVGGGMYIGRNNRMSITNLMVDPGYRRQGIGQALLIKRLERLAERGFPFVTAQVLDTNSASLENLKKQNFEVFNRFSVYERTLPLPEYKNSTSPPLIVRMLIARTGLYSEKWRKKNHTSIRFARRWQLRKSIFSIRMAKNIRSLHQIYQMDQDSSRSWGNDRFFIRRFPPTTEKRGVAPTGSHR